jgi:hypothetical protein
MRRPALLLSLALIGLPLLLLGCPEQTVGSYNTGPQATITLPGPDALIENDSVTFAGSVHDDQDSPDELTVIWMDNRTPDVPLNEAPADTAGFMQFTVAGMAAGTHLITLQVTDTDGVTDEDSIEVTILTDPPVVIINQPLSGSDYYQDVTIQFEGQVESPELGEFSLQVVWASDPQGELFSGMSDDDGRTTFESVLDTGLHTITLTATDSEGVSGVASKAIEVLPYPLGQLDQDGDGYCPDGLDTDGDGFCTDAEVTGPGTQDCNDDPLDARAPFIHPGADEICDGWPDNNCDGVFDETDDDADGDDWSPCMGDCDDGNPLVNPGAMEICDGQDTNCDGFLPPDEVDEDGDGWYLCQDCDDTEQAANPGMTEICDGIDNDCDGVTDNGYDLDGDSWSTCEGDCDDLNAAINPSQPEICNDWDDNCDGRYNENADPTELGESDMTIPGGFNQYIELATFEHVFALPPFFNCAGDLCTSLFDGAIQLCENSTSTTGGFASQFDPFDVYRIDYNTALGFVTGCPFTATMTVPPGHNYGLQLYGASDVNDPSTWDLLDSSDVSGNGTETVEFVDSVFGIFTGSQDLMLVVLSNGHYDCPSIGSYQLDVSGF